MRNLLLSIMISIPFFVFAQGWDPISPEGASVDFFNFMPIEHFVSGNILYCQNGDTLQMFDYMLPITATEAFNDSIILVAMGDGSYSDGVHFYNINTNQAEVSDYFYKPKTLKKFNDVYYVGYEGGLSKSSDGITWVNMLNFSSPNTVVDFFVDEENYMAVVDDNENNYIQYSSDLGENWVSYPLNLTPTVCAYDLYNSGLVVVDGGEDAASGVYISYDYGETFDNLVQTEGLTSAYFLNNEELAIGYGERETDPQGIIILNLVTNIPRQLTGDIPNDDINSLTVHPYIDCYNLIACTQNGVYMTCDLTGMDEVQGNESTISVYPNPITAESIISGKNINIQGHVKVTLMNVQGQRIAETYVDLNGDSTFNVPLTNIIDNLSSGIYFITVTADSGKTNSIKFVVE